MKIYLYIFEKSVPWLCIIYACDTNVGALGSIAKLKKKKILKFKAFVLSFVIGCAINEVARFAHQKNSATMLQFIRYCLFDTSKQ